MKNKFKVPVENILRFTDFVRSTFEFVKPHGPMPKKCRDEDDNKILHLADHANADEIITGDDDLLSLRKFKGISIITPRQFMEKFV